MKVLMGYLATELRGGQKFQLDFSKHFDTIQVGFLSSNVTIKYENLVKKIGPIHLIPPTRKFFARLKTQRRLADEYEIIYLNKTTLNPFEFVLVKMAGFKYVVIHSHSIGKDCKNPYVKAGYYFLHYMSRPLVGKIADKMYACSEEAGEWLFGKQFKKFGKVIPNGIDAQLFRYDEEKRNKIREKMKIEGSCIFHAGAFSAVKNQGYLIGAFAHFHKLHPDSILMFAGQGELMEQAKERTRSLGIENSVMFLGQRNDVADLMQAADLFVLPSLLEGLPFVAMEAQAAGLPCIITARASEKVKITNLCQFFDISKREEELSAAMEKQLELGRRDTMSEIRDAGFDLKRCAEELETELINLVK